MESPQPSKRVLLVDDNSSNLTLTAEALRESGLEVVSVADGAAAVSAARAACFDAILMDDKMPIMNGADAIAAIRSTDKETPIIGFTAAVDQTSRERLRTNGANRVLTKPLPPSALVAAINQMVSHDA